MNKSFSLSHLLMSAVMTCVTAAGLCACTEVKNEYNERAEKKKSEIVRLQSDLQSWGIAIPDSLLTDSVRYSDRWELVKVLDEIVEHFDSTGTDRQVWTTRAYELFFVEQRPLTTESLSEFFREKSGKGSGISRGDCPLVI